MIYLYLAKAIEEGMNLEEFEGMAFLRHPFNDDRYIVWRQDGRMWRFDYFDENVKVTPYSGYNKSDVWAVFPGYGFQPSSFDTAELDYVNDLEGAWNPFMEWIRKVMA